MKRGDRHATFLHFTAEDLVPIIAAAESASEVETSSCEFLGRLLAGPSLQAHLKGDYLTNIYFPQEKANGGWVDYMRMGYGKERRRVQLLAEKGGINTELKPFGQRDMISFFMTLVDEFHHDMVDTYAHATKECNYNASLFANMISEMGGLQTARVLLAQGRSVRWIYGSVGIKGG